jgi:hypothetical protein
MITYSFISDLFTTVLQQSSTIQGRFFVSGRNGQEINSDILGQVLTDATTQVQVQKYPLAMMAAPVSRGTFEKMDGWLPLRCTIFFLRTTYYDANGIAEVNPNTQTSMRPVLSDWSEMAAVAIDFVRVLNSLMRVGGIGTFFRLDRDAQNMTPVSTVGIDRVSGVRLDFNVSLFLGCEIIDYPSDVVTQVTTLINNQLSQS